MKHLSTTSAYLKSSFLIPAFLVMGILFGCNHIDPQTQKQQEAIREQLLGEWKLHTSVGDIDEFMFTMSGMTFFKDSIDFHHGFFNYTRDSLTGRDKQLYLGNFCAYGIRTDSIFVKSPYAGKQEFKWRFIKRVADTLFLETKDSTQAQFSRLSYNMDTLPDFDRIIYSNSGCYGSCPIMDISINKKGELLYKGAGFVSPTGVYSGKMSPEKTTYIFTKFRKANPLNCSDNYSVGHTDDQTITTTYIKDGKIVKSINDYGGAGPAELIWAYVAIANAYGSTGLDTLTTIKPFSKEFNCLSFKKEKLELRLEKSESFYLWTELRKSKQTGMTFNSLYTLTYLPYYSYWGYTHDGSKQSVLEISSIKTDGRFFKFEFKKEPPFTYDLGYNFVERNFTEADFKKPLLSE